MVNDGIQNSKSNSTNKLVRPDRLHFGKNHLWGMNFFRRTSKGAPESWLPVFKIEISQSIMALLNRRKQKRCCLQACSCKRQIDSPERCVISFESNHSILTHFNKCLNENVIFHLMVTAVTGKNVLLGRCPTRVLPEPSRVWPHAQALNTL